MFLFSHHQLSWIIILRKPGWGTHRNTKRVIMTLNGPWIPGFLQNVTPRTSWIIYQCFSCHFNSNVTAMSIKHIPYQHNMHSFQSNWSDSYLCISPARIMKPGWTCGSWRPSWGNATSPTRATTVAGKCLPRRTLCPTRRTWCRLPRRRPPTTRRAERTPTFSASRRGSASSDRRADKRTGARAGKSWQETARALRDSRDRKRKVLWI